MRRFEHTTRVRAYWLGCLPFLIGTAWAAEPRVADAPTVSRELIQYLSRATGPQSGNAETLRGTVEQAARDPKDNVVQLKETTAGTAVAIRLTSPLVYDPQGDIDAGRDCIEAGPGGLILEGDPELPAVILVRGGKLTLRGIEIVGGQRSILVSDQADVTVDNCRIRKSGGAGISVFGNAYLLMQEGSVTDSASHGVEAHDQSRIVLSGPSLRRNGQGGVALFGNARCDAQNSLLEDNGQWGFVATDESRLQAVQCVIRGTGFADVDAGRSATMDLDACHLVEGRRFGVIAGGHSVLSLRGTRIVSHASRGMELQGDANVTLNGTAIEKSGNFGVVLFGRSVLRADQCVFRGNRGHGLALRDHATADLYDSHFERNEYSGVGAPDATDGGRLAVRRCLFRGNGMRPVYRGPVHLDPLVPTVVGIHGGVVLVRTTPLAEVDLYSDRMGEADQFLGTVRADARGECRVPLDMATWPCVVTASATTPDGHTSEFNVVAGKLDRQILAALLARTGPLSDESHDGIHSQAAVHRWRTGSRVMFVFDQAPPHVSRYTTWFVDRLNEWTDHAVDVQVAFGSDSSIPRDAIVIPVRYAAASDAHLNGTGGTTYTRWDPSGYFTGPVRIFLSMPEPGRHACPRVAIHEMLHAMGLYHARVGLLTRMQGIPTPGAGYLNDFSPAPTFYDVVALQALYNRQLGEQVTLAQMTTAGLLPPVTPDEIGNRVISQGKAAANRAMAVDASGRERVQSSLSPSANRR